MRGRQSLMLLVLALALPVAAAATDLFDYYLVVDTSGSMGGRPRGGSNVDIMPRVKEAIAEFVTKLPLGVRVALMPFDTLVHDVRRIALDREEDRQALIRVVEALDPRGSQTCIGRALSSVLIDVEHARRLAGENALTSTILLYTDGLEECRGVSKYGEDDEPGLRPPSLAKILEKFRLMRGPNDYLYYTTLGLTLPAGDRKLLSSTPGVRLVEEPRGRVDPIALVSVRPAALDFGDLGATGDPTRQLSLSYGQQLREQAVSVTIEIDGLAPEEAVRVAPERFILSGAEAPIALRLLNRSSFRQRVFTGHLVLRGAGGRLHVTPERIPVRFSTLPPLSFGVSSATTLPAALGELPLGPDGGVKAEVRFLIQPSSSARSSGARFRVEATLDPANPAPLAAGGAVRLEAGTVRGQSVVVDARAQEFRLAIEVPGTGSAPAIPPGQYRGTLVFRSDTAEVTGQGLQPLAGAVRASRTAFSFGVPGERTVRIDPPPGGFPFDLGTFVLRSVGPVTGTRSLVVRFSPEAAARGATVRADLAIGTGNPATIVPGEHLHLQAGAEAGRSVTFDGKATQLTMNANLPVSAKPGVYGGRLILWPSGAVLSGPGLEQTHGSPWARALPFRFTAELEKQLAIECADPAEELGDLVSGKAPARLERSFKLVWSDSARHGGATARAALKWQPEAAFATLSAGSVRGAEIELTPEHGELVLTVDGSAGAGIGNYAGVIELTPRGCAIAGNAFHAPADPGGPWAARLHFRVPRPAWMALSLAALLLSLAGAWGYAASLPRFGASVRLAIEEGHGSGGSYYLRGHQGRFSRQVVVGGAGGADLGLPGLAGRSFAIRLEGGGRYRVVALSPIALRLPENAEEALATGQSRPLPDGAAIRVAELSLLFSEHA